MNFNFRGAFIAPLFFLLLISDWARAQSEIIEQLSQQNYRVLAGRVEASLSQRIKISSEACSSQQLTLWRNQHKGLNKITDSKLRAEKALRILLGTFEVSPACRESLDKSEASFLQNERQSFQIFQILSQNFCRIDTAELIQFQDDHAKDPFLQHKDCLFTINQIFSELDPHCVSVQVGNKKGYYDPFPCMAADYFIGRILYDRKNPWTLVQTTRQFFLNLQELIYRKDRSPIDVSEEFLKVAGDIRLNKKKFLALMTLLSASTDSAGSYVKGWHDYFWRASLLQYRNPRMTVDFFNQTKLLVDEYRSLSKNLVLQKPWTQVGPTLLKEMNRHNYMAAFLSCHYQNTKLSVALGFAYEAKDYFTHLAEGDSLATAYENFKHDTNRYKQSSRWGLEFCQK